MVKALLDTDILIDLLRQYQPAHAWISTQVDIGVATVVWIELLQGASTKLAQQKAFKLLNIFDRVETEKVDFEWAIQALLKFHTSHNVSGSDALIAAVTYRLQVPLYTRNLKHFTPMLGSLAQKPY